MKSTKIKALMIKGAVALTFGMALTAISPMQSANAAWRQNNTGWWYTEGSSWSTGWREIDNNWYYFDADGYMQANKWIDNYFVDNSGAWTKTCDAGTWVQQSDGLHFLVNGNTPAVGWKQLQDKWYYFGENGKMQTGTIVDNGKQYTLDAMGVWNGASAVEVKTAEQATTVNADATVTNNSTVDTTAVTTSDNSSSSHSSSSSSSSNRHHSHHSSSGSSNTNTNNGGNGSSNDSPSVPSKAEVTTGAGATVNPVKPKDDKPTEKPADKPEDKPVVNPSEKPADKPVVNPSEKPADKPADKPSDKPADKPVVNPSDKPTEKPADKPVVNPSDKPEDKPVVTPSDKPTDPIKPEDKPVVTPSDKPADKPVVTPSDKPVVTPTDKPADKPTDKPADPTGKGTTVGDGTDEIYINNGKDKPADTSTVLTESAFYSKVCDRLNYLVNVHRGSNGKTTLSISSDYKASSKAKSQDMVDNNYFAHERDGKDFQTLNNELSGVKVFGENIAMNYFKDVKTENDADNVADTLFDQWKTSPSHNKNMLEDSWKTMGFGYAKGKEDSGYTPIYATQHFGY